jgi:hypothetical protein
MNVGFELLNRHGPNMPELTRLTRSGHSKVVPTDCESCCAPASELWLAAELLFKSNLRLDPLVSVYAQPVSSYCNSMGGSCLILRQETN